MKKIFFLMIAVCIFSGCQVIELKHDGMGQDIQLSNTNWSQGDPVYAYKKAWYILDLGPVNDASLKAIVDYKIPQRGDLYGTTITTTFNWFDASLRLVQDLYIGLPIVGSRTIIVEGQTNY